MLFFPHPVDIGAARNHPVVDWLSKHCTNGSRLFAFAGPAKYRTGKDVDAPQHRIVSLLTSLHAASAKDYFYGVLGRDPEGRGRLHNQLLATFPNMKASSCFGGGRGGRSRQRETGRRGAWPRPELGFPGGRSAAVARRFFACGF